MAARGYWLAFQSVQRAVEKVLRGENPGQVADDDHGTWYRELFAPSVTTGLLRAFRPRRLSQWAGLHPQVDARSSESRCRS